MSDPIRRSTNRRIRKRSTRKSAILRDGRSSLGQELLVSPMLALSHHSFSVKGLYNAEGKSLGMSLIQVANTADAEKVRSYCSGQLLDAGKSIQLSVILS